MSVQKSAPVRQAFPDPIPGILRFGSINLWSGASGVGKTIMLAEWFARMRDGRSIWYKPTNRPTDFYVLAADRDWSTYQEVFADVGFPDVKNYVLADDLKEEPKAWARTSGLALYERCLAKLSPIPGSLLLVDPVSPLFIGGDQNRARDCAISLHTYRRASKKYQITQILTSNTIKISADATAGYKRSRDNISGSGALVANSDTSIYTEPAMEPGGPTIIGWAPRRAKEETFQCQFDPETRLFIPYRGVTDEGQTADTDRPTQALLFLPDEGSLPRHLWYDRARPLLQISLATFKRDIEQLLLRGLVMQDSFGKYSKAKLQ